MVPTIHVSLQSLNNPDLRPYRVEGLGLGIWFRVYYHYLGF